MYLLIGYTTSYQFFFAELFGKKLKPKGSSVFFTICLSLTFLISSFMFYEVSVNRCCFYIKLFTWIDSGALNINWGFMFDSLTINYVLHY